MLRLTRAQEQDTGFYSCLASNEAGEVRRNFSIEVLGMSHPHSHVDPMNSSSATLELLEGPCPGLRAHAVAGSSAQEGGRGQALSSVPDH